MQHRGLLIFGLVLLGVGFVGLLTVEALAPLTVTTFGSIGRSLGGGGSSAARGQRIYQTGLNSDGQSIPRTAQSLSQGALMMGGGGCASCHGANGQGSAVSMMMGYIEAPDITYRSLTNEGYDQRTISRAIRYGIDENSKPLDSSMPRWQMTDAEVRDVLAYLKELSPR